MVSSIDENVSSASNETFWSIISRYKIVIPRMQRNYSQGKEEPDITPKREVLLNDIFNSLIGNTKLDLNFVYGNVSDDVLIPIDGQQRLTTLFLLYWYFLQLSDNKSEDYKNLLNNFSYETRYVTMQFCKKLVNDVEIDLFSEKNDNIIDVIKDYYWFFTDFDYDISIKGMLVTLSEIHKRAKKYGLDRCKSFFELLISDNCPITFLFLNINDIGLTDEIYIKMNARGKPLTEFENFKAQLAGYLSKHDENFSDVMLLNFNGKWSQFFWSIQTDGKIVFDDQMMNVIRFMMFNDYLCNNESHNLTVKNVCRSVLTKLNNETMFEFTNRLFKDEFKQVYEFINAKPVVNKDTFVKIYKILNALSYKYEKTKNIDFLVNDLYCKRYINETELFNKLINNIESLTYDEKVITYAEFSFIAKYSEEDGSFNKNEELTHWIRFIQNLAKGTIYNQLDDYSKSIKSVDKMLNENNALDVLKYASSVMPFEYKKGYLFGFSEIQTSEEMIKSYLITESNEWKKLIIEAENSYLDNQIISLINFSGIESIYDIEVNNIFNRGIQLGKRIDLEVNEYIDKFRNYLKKIELFFDKNGLRKEFEYKSVFRRSLLTFGGEDSYLIRREGVTYSFLNNSDRNYSFRRLLRDDNDGKRIYFKNLLDVIDISENSIDSVKKQLLNIINAGVEKEKNSWKYYFISMPEILDSLTNEGDDNYNYIFRNNCRFINMKSKDEILLCESKSTRSMNRELYSYVLYLKAINMGYNVNYFKDYRESSEKYLYYKGTNDEEIQILYLLDPIDNKFKYTIRTSQVINCRTGDINYVLNYIAATIK